MADAARPTPQAVLVPARRTWSLPILRELPKLTDLTLASAIGGTGGTGGGGSTVFGLLLAVGLLVGGCTADQSLEPGAPMPKVLATISCTGDVQALTVSCAAPQSSPGVEILGGQGIKVALRSSNILINGFNEFTFDVTLQNLSAQQIGHTGTSSTGEQVFFVSGPTAVGGTMQVMGGSVGTFTAPGQAFYQYIGSLAPLATSAPVNWKLHMTGPVTSFNFTVMVAADVFDLGGVLRWTPIDGTTQRWYNDVAASSATDRMVVGNEGLSAHYTGGAWVPLPKVTYEAFTSVFALAPGEYLATTGSGAVFHFKNSVWTELYHRGDYVSLNAIWAKDTGQIVAVGNGGVTSHYYTADGIWIDEDLPTGGENFMAVSGSADGSLVSAVSWLYPDGRVWLSSGEGAFGLSPQFPMIFGIPTDIAYDGSGNALLAFIFAGGPGSGLVLSSTGQVLLDDPSVFPVALVPYGTDKVAMGVVSGGIYGVADLDYSSPPGTPFSLTDPVPTFDIVQFTVTDAGVSQFNVTTSSGHLLSWDGATWTDDQGFGDWSDPDIWGIGDTVFALDGIGGFYKIVNGVKTTMPTGGAFYHLWGQSSTEFWAINATQAWHFDVVNGWTNEHTVPGGSDNRDVWADPTGDAVIVLGENGWISSRVLGTWSDQFIPRNLTAVWGCNSHQAWITTLEGEIYKWVDGVVTLDEALGPDPLRGINGNQFCDPWAVGDNGAVFHLSGGSWQDRWDPYGGTWTLRAVAIRGADQTIAAGDFGYGGLFSDASQLQQTPFPTQGKGITSLWRLSNGEVYAAGNQFLLRGSR